MLTVLDECGFDFGGRQSMPGDIDDVVDTTADPVIAFMIATSAVARELEESLVSFARRSSFIQVTHVVALVHIQIRIHVPLVRAPNCASHAWPWLLDCQDTLNIVTVQLLARDRVDDSGFDTEKGQRGATGFRGCDTCQWSDDMGTGFGLPVCLSAG